MEAPVSYMGQVGAFADLLSFDASLACIYPWKYRELIFLLAFFSYLLVVALSQGVYTHVYIPMNLQGASRC